MSELSPALSSPRRARALGVILLVGVFAAGAVFGAGLVRTHAPRPPGPPPSPSEHLARTLQLTPAQRAELHRIEAAHRAELRALMRETMPRIRAVQDRIADELRPSLTDEQRARLDELEAHRPPPDAPLPGMPGGPPPGAPPPF